MEASLTLLQFMFKASDRAAAENTIMRRDWGTVFGDPIIATAVLDRLLHHSTTVNIRGGSYRLKGRHRAGSLASLEQREES